MNSFRLFWHMPNKNYRIKNFLFCVVNPRNWVSNERTDWIYDKNLNEILDSNPKIEIGNCTIFIGETEIWTSNFPYAYGSIYSRGYDKSGLPSMLTRYRLRRYIKNYK